MTDLGSLRKDQGKENKGDLCRKMRENTRLIGNCKPSTLHTSCPTQSDLKISHWQWWTFPLASSPIPLMRSNKKEERETRPPALLGEQRKSHGCHHWHLCKSTGLELGWNPPAELLKPQAWWLKHWEAAFMPLENYRQPNPPTVI